MWNRLKILTLLQLSNKINLRFLKNRRFAASVALGALVIVLLSGVLAGLLYLVKNVLYIPVDVYFVIFVLLLTQLVSILSSTNGLIVDLYSSKDNQILLSFPVKNDEVFISKLMTYFVHEFLRNLSFLIPLLIGFGFVNRMPWWYYANIPVLVFLLPALSVLIASLVSLPLMAVLHFFSKRNLLSFLVLLVVLVAAFFGFTWLVGKIPSPIRIVQLYNRFINNLSLFMQTAAQFASIYNVIGKLLFGIHLLRGYLILLGTVGGAVLLAFLISRPLYFRLVSRTMETADERRRRFKNRVRKGLFATFLWKEWKISSRSVNEVLGNYSILFAFPFFLYLLNTIYLNIPRSGLGNLLMVVFDLILSLFLVTSSNTAAATALTTEGYEFILLKTAPSDTGKIAWAKLTLNLAISTAIIGLSFLAFHVALPNFPLSDLYGLIAVIVVVDWSHILWSLQIDIQNPRLAEYALTGSLSNNPNVAQSVSGGFVLSLVFGLLFAALRMAVPSFAWTGTLIAAGLYLLFRIAAFTGFLRADFSEIEF